jgi:hypothetical protein
MSAVLIIFGVIVGVGLAVLLPWALLRKLESEDQDEEDC